MTARETSATQSRHERGHGDRNRIDVDPGKESEHALPDRLVKQCRETRREKQQEDEGEDRAGSRRTKRHGQARATQRSAESFRPFSSGAAAPSPPAHPP